MSDCFSSELNNLLWKRDFPPYASQPSKTIEKTMPKIFEARARTATMVAQLLFTTAAL
jgi:hypothetical protein